MSFINVGIVGYGYWGPNLVRNFSELDSCRVKMVCDLESSRLQKLTRRYPAIEVTRDWREMLADPDIDAVAVATPVSTHYAIARAALIAGKHVLIEKPMASSVKECLELVELSKKCNRVLLVDHTFIYTPAVRKIRELIDKGELGNIVYFDSVRVNLGLFQHDVNVIWDLAPHDISIMLYTLERVPRAVRAVGLSVPELQHASIAYLTFEFDEPLIGHAHVNWFAPVKIRQTLIAGTQKMVVYDDNEPSEKIKIYDKGINLSKHREEIYRTLVQYRTGDMSCPKLEQTEALLIECEHFLDCINGNASPISGGELGLEVVRVLEAAALSLEQNGAPVELSSLPMAAAVAP
jgi:predicted dehydrogenase